MANSTMVTVFLLEGFAEDQELRVLLAMVLLLMYLATLLGNLLIVTVTSADQNLHTPMYFFLRNLSLVDMCFISVTVPNACVNSLTGNRAISGAGCAAQIFLVVFSACVELLFLTVIAWDRYAAICQPLQYPLIMNPQFCVRMTLASLLSGVVYAGAHTGDTFLLDFCGSNVVPQFFCDIPSLLRLSCSDTSRNELSILVSTVVVAGGAFVGIVTSYVRILSSVRRFPARARGKAFSTCAPHVLVVSVFLSASACVYLRPLQLSEKRQDVVLSVLYAVVPPLSNPIIYSLRNKQMKEAVGKVLLRKFHSGKV